MATKTTHLGLSKAELTDAVRSTLTANNENFDKIDEAYAEVNETIDEKEQALQGQIDRLRANQVQGSASGTEIVVQDSAEMESVLRVSGNSEQETRSGKNKLKLIKNTRISNGLEWNITEDKVKVSGVAEGDYSQSGQVSHSTPVGTYKLVVGSNVNIQFGVWLYNASGTIIATLKNGGTATIAEEAPLYAMFVEGLTAGQTYDVTVEPMLLPSTETDLSYEPYGVQPSPDYPSEIRSVKSKSDNLFDINGNVNTRYDDLTGAYNTVSGNNLTTTLNNNLTHGYGQKIYVGAGNTITFSAKLLSIGNTEYTGNGDVGAVTCYNYGDTASRITINFKLQDKGKIRTSQFTAQTDYVVLAFGTYATITPTVTFTDIMLNKGLEALPYQPYGYVPVELKVEGKNKLKLTAGTHTINGVTVTVAEDGLITLNGTIQGNYPSVKLTNGLESLIALDYVNNSGWLKEEIGLVGKFTLKRFEVGGTVSNSSTPFVCLYNQNGERLTFMSRVTQIINSDTSSPLACAVLYLGEKDYVYSNYQFYLMLEEGTTQTTEYEPYKLTTISLPLGDIVLRSTPDGTRDTFARVDGKWNKRGDIASKILTSEDEIYADLNYGNLIRYDAFVLSDAKPLNENKCLSSTFTMVYGSNPDYESARNAGEGFPTSFIFYLKKDRMGNPTTVADAKTAMQTWLANNPTEVQYPLATPTYTPITDQALISALDELEQLILHKGYNYITATSVNGVKAQLDLSYIKDINAVLDNLTAAILTLGGELNV